jgi:anaerobic ribonucleoside-triphosphate reductase activating protein
MRNDKPRNPEPRGGHYVNLHAVLARCGANGPGVRSVIWFQGCSLGCRGCFNPESHAPNRGYRTCVGDLVGEIAARRDAISGLTVSGGEPFQQPAALYRLLHGIGAASDLSILVFSGYRLAQIERMAEGPSILRHVDVLIAGRYLPSRHLATGMLGSTNQHIHLLTDRHSIGDITRTPAAEVRIAADGRVTVTGIDPAVLSLP